MTGLVNNNNNVSNSDDDIEVVDEKLVSSAKIAQAKQEIGQASDEVSVQTQCETSPSISSSNKQSQNASRSRKRPANTPITIIDIDDEDIDAGLGSSWRTATLRSCDGDNAGLPSVIPLVSDDDESSNDGEPAAKTRRSEDGEVPTAAARAAPVIPRPLSRRSGNCLSVEYLRNFFRPIGAYAARQGPGRMEQFNKQLWRHFQDNIQNDKTFTWKMRVRLMLHKVINKLFKDCHLIAVGSTINGCGAYSSDMDLCLCVDGLNRSQNNRRHYAMSTLHKIQNKMMKTSFVRRCITIPAKVPILKMWFTAPYEALEVDLNVNNTAGIYNSYLLHYYSRVDDRFSAICIFVKHWAKLAGIGDAFAGTFNSYSLILMVVHLLQVVCDPPVLPNLQQLYPDVFCDSLPLARMKLFGDLPRTLNMTPRNTQTVGELVIAFFKYYTEFDYDNNGISIANACVFPRDELSESTRRFKIYIEEPFDQQNTARCITSDDSWATIQAAFRRATGNFLWRNADPPNLDSFLAQFTA